MNFNKAGNNLSLNSMSGGSPTTGFTQYLIKVVSLILLHISNKDEIETRMSL